MNAEHLEVIDTVKYLRTGTKIVEGMNDYLADNKPALNIDWTTLHMVKGAVFGEYYKLWREGSKPIANQILLEEGVPQKLTERHIIFLDRFDKKYGT